MKFLTFTIFTLVALTRGEGIQDKRGVAANQAYAAPQSIAYTKLQQPVQKAVVAAAPQPQYYAQPAPVKYAAAPAAYSVPVQQQFQYEPQQVAYRPQFSLANDVSSFAYSSPVVSYNNLGLLSQVLGKSAAPVQTKVSAAPAPAVYQAPVQKVAYAQPAPVAYAPAPVQAKVALPASQPVQAKLVAAPQLQQYLTQLPQQFAQQTYVAGSQQQAYSAAPQQQAYSAAPQSQAYSAAPQQAYTAAAQSIPQAVYSQAPQYFGSQQVKQVSSGVAYAQ
ncbi:altered inheritance of mitochondria protein 3 [Asbolus verrucosus]|uniref:Altered inheritance of mitochondria protein 3 n=1 Tax=Asbolus verrucosus TaxID=1661398 RepID=A0A482WAH9_ASBVE|nr:altered inheritance of mitochondria protein 3 [Asbolus verrucosus]